MIVGSWVQRMAWEIILYVFHKMVEEWGSQAWHLFSNWFFGVPLPVLDDPLVVRLVQVAIGLVLGFLPVAIGWMVFRETVARMDGAGTMPPETLVRRAIVTGAAVTGTSTAAWVMVKLAERSREVVASLGVSLNLFQNYFEVPQQLTWTVGVLGLVFLVGVIVLVIQRVVVEAEFTVLLIIGPVMAAGLLKEGGQNAFGIWLREMIALLLTPLIQMLTSYLFIHKWAATKPEFFDRLAALGFLYVLWNTPRWARQMVYSVGAGDAVVGAGVGAARMVIMRQMIRAVTKV